MCDCRVGHAKGLAWLNVAGASLDYGSGPKGKTGCLVVLRLL